MFHVIVAVIACLATLWALAVWVVGGFEVTLPGFAIRAFDPFRPLALGATAAALYFASGGRIDPKRWIVPLAVLLSIFPAAAGIARNSWTAGGADSYAYVSQAELWLRGTLSVPVPLAAEAPWPESVWTFSPHGFKPAVAAAAIVPVTAPGLPLLMAGAKALGGHCAMFLVTPLSGALLVWMTFALGRRLDSPSLGLIAAWLAATSPAVLAMLVSPMSDVPAAAFWAAAFYFATGTSSRSSLLAGAAASMAILIRPNLAPLAAILALWKLPERPHLAVYIAAVVPGCLAVALVNAALYGSPLASGYGPLSSLFSLANVHTNVARYGRWLVESQTPLAVLGLAALFVPAQSIWRNREQVRVARLLGFTAATVWGLYLIYSPYDAWWFLRFLLPSWTAMCLGAAVLLLRVIQARSLAIRLVGFALIAGVGIYGLRFAAANGAFPSGEGDHRYVSIAKMVEAATEPGAVVFAGQHSGPIRYYAGREIVRFDLLDPASFDLAVSWLDARGRPPYVLLEDWELPSFRDRFRGATTLETLTAAPIVAYRAPGVPGSVFLFDPLHPEGRAIITTPPRSASPKCVAPSPLLH